MREIKFRAWDGKRLSEPFTFNNIVEPMGMRGNFVCDLIGSENKRYYFEIKECKVIQFTGLKDKNGKEIFEGDIVKTDNHNGVHYFIVEFEEDYCGSLGAFVHRCIDDENISSVHSRAVDEGEVIGNKFENPELLKGGSRK